jgi:hypothetical protein
VYEEEDERGGLFRGLITANVLRSLPPSLPSSSYSLLVLQMYTRCNAARGGTQKNLVKKVLKRTGGTTQSSRFFNEYKGLGLLLPARVNKALCRKVTKKCGLDIANGS